MYLSAVAFGMVLGGIIIKQDDDFYDDAEIRAYNMLFGGGLITTFFWVIMGCIICVLANGLDYVKFNYKNDSLECYRCNC